MESVDRGDKRLVVPKNCMGVPIGVIQRINFITSFSVRRKGKNKLNNSYTNDKSWRLLRDYITSSSNRVYKNKLTYQQFSTSQLTLKRYKSVYFESYFYEAIDNKLYKNIIQT